MKDFSCNYFIGRMPLMGPLLSWADKHGTTPISRMALESLRSHLDEDPVFISHALWAYLNVNLVSAAKEIFNNNA